jgi:hypothetical protein
MKGDLNVMSVIRDSEEIVTCKIILHVFIPQKRLFVVGFATNHLKPNLV